MAMGSAELALGMILMKQMAGITNFQTIQTIQAMPEHSDLDGDSTDSSVTNLALEEPGAMQSEAIERKQGPAPQALLWQPASIHSRQWQFPCDALEYHMGASAGHIFTAASPRAHELIFGIAFDGLGINAIGVKVEHGE